MMAGQPHRPRTLRPTTASGGTQGATAPGGARRRSAQKELARVERDLERAAQRDDEIQTAMAAAATDPIRLQQLSADLDILNRERHRLEYSWLELSEQLER